MGDVESTAPSTESRPEAPPPKPRRSWPKRIAFALGALAVALLAAGILLEIGLRVCGWSVRSMAPIGALHRYQPWTGWELAPNREVILEGDSYGSVVVRTNAQGFRMPRDVALEREPGRARVVVLGDSFTWGWGVPVEQCFPERIATLSGAEVINAGTDAFGTGQEWLLFRERLKVYRPDVVIVGFYVGNDYRDNVVRQRKRPWFRLDEAGKVVVENVPVPKPFATPLDELAKDHLVSYGFLAYELARAKARIQSSDGWVGEAYRREREKNKNRDAIVDEQEAFSGADPFRKKPSKDFERAVELAQAILVELKKECDGIGAKLLVAVLPSRQMVDGAMWNAEPSEGLSRDQPAITTVRICEERGIAAVDCTAALRATDASGKPTFLTHEGIQPGFHMNATGHEVAAKVIHDDLVRRGWLAR